MAVSVEEIREHADDRPQFVLTTDKFNTTYTVKPTEDGYIFYHIIANKGKLASPISGYYSSADKAIADFKLWESRQKLSQARKRDELSKLREQRRKAN